MTAGEYRDKSDRKRARRLFAVAAFCLLVCALFAGRLLYLQLFTPDETVKTAVGDHVFKTGLLDAARGEIYDRNGKKFVSNRPTFRLTLNRTTLASGTANDTLSALIDILSPYGVTLPDQAPLTDEPPYALDNEYLFDPAKVRTLDRFAGIVEKERDSFAGEEFYAFLCDRYDIDESLAATSKGRKIAGIRYDMEVADFSVRLPFTLLDNIDDGLQSVIAEHLHELHGLQIVTSYSRYYDMGSTLCHLLGRIGPIYAEEAEEYIEEKGYGYNDLIGKDGAERVFEPYLRGIGGYAEYEIDENNDIVGVNVTQEPKPGYDVRLTVDAELQKVLEESITEQIGVAVASSRKEYGIRKGEDCYAGAGVVLDVNSGAVLASASVPGYDRNTYSSLYNELLRDDPHRPEFNRAMMGIYPPGSTFKILTAAAALDSGTITRTTSIYDAGEYTKYAPTYTPRCWIYPGSHGYVDVTRAIKVSCNYFFYSIADRMGISTLDKYASDFGLGVSTGIEVPEYEGILAGPDYRSSIGKVWFDGDTLQMAIGQSDNAFTPLQLASYMATVVNGGNRYKATILKSVDDHFTGEPIYVNEPVVLNKTHLSDDTVEILKYAMRSVVDDEEGTAQNIFRNKPYANNIGGKTGTAQVTGGSDTVLFVGFAPYENPEIAVAVVIENGYKSARAASVAASVFDAYFAAREST